MLRASSDRELILDRSDAFEHELFDRDDRGNVVHVFHRLHHLDEGRTPHFATSGKELDPGEKVVAFGDFRPIRFGRGRHDLDRFVPVGDVIKPGHAFVDGLDEVPGDLLSRRGPPPRYLHAGLRQVAGIVANQSNVAEAEPLRLETGRRDQHGRVDRAGFQRGEARTARSDDEDVVVALLEAVRNQHAIEINTVDIAQTADSDRLAFEVLDRLDARLCQHRVVGRLTDDPQYCNRRAFLDRVDRLDHSIDCNQIQRAGGKLLDETGCRRPKNDIELDPALGEKSFPYSNQDRPSPRRVGAQHPGHDFLNRSGAVRAGQGKAGGDTDDLRNGYDTAHGAAWYPCSALCQRLSYNP